MATTNIALAKHLDGRPVVVEDIKVGLNVFFPHVCGGVHRHECVFVDSKEAQFESTNKEWPSTFIIKFNQPDFTHEEFEELKKALVAYGNLGMLLSDDQRRIVLKAQELGYAKVRSHTQAHWTEAGIAAYRAQKQN